MRLIDADALRRSIDRLMPASILHQEVFKGDVICAIQDAPTVAKDINVPGWISVKDRLPEDDRQVLGVKRLESGIRKVGLTWCIREWKYTDPVTGATTCAPYWKGGATNIVAWMPIPEPPEDETEEESCG